MSSERGRPSWQAFYDGTGPKPALPLAPGTNAPAPHAGVVVNVPPGRAR